MAQYKKGLVVGKFMPLHKGHEYLLRVAMQYCDELVVVVDCIEGQTIDAQTRKRWIDELIPGLTVVALEEQMPQEPAETPEFWNIWKQALFEAAGGDVDVLVTSMGYGRQLAATLGSELVQFDVARISIPVSATDIRASPFSMWDYLTNPARVHFMKKVCIVGPESCGKSTTAQELARRYNTVYVPEFAESLIRDKDGKFDESDVLKVARGQVFTEKALIHMVNKLMICDSSPLTTLVWSEVLFGSHPAELDELVRACKYDQVLLFDASTPWVADDHRSVLAESGTDESRQKFYELFKFWLERFGISYLEVGGTFEERKAHSRVACESLLNS